MAFFILVTARDVDLASRALRSLARLDRLSFPCSVTVYFNGVSLEAERKLGRAAARLRHAELRSNRASADVWNAAIAPAVSVISDGEIEEIRHGACETGGEVWSRELPMLAADFVCQMDGDFEVLAPGFLEVMYRALVDDSRLAVVSVDRSATALGQFDSYSRRTIDLPERVHTWCAMWRRECAASEEGFWFRTVASDGGERVPYDHGVFLQSRLRQRGFKTLGLDDLCPLEAARLREDWIHYGAFSNNRTLKGPRLRAYRLCRIARHNGWRHLHGSARVARSLKKLGDLAFAALGFGLADQERTRYPYQ